MKNKNRNKITLVLTLSLFVASACSGGGGVDMDNPLARELAGKNFRISSSDLLHLGGTCPISAIGSGNSSMDYNYLAKFLESSEPVAQGNTQTPTLNNVSDANTFPADSQNPNGGTSAGSSSTLRIFFDGNGTFWVNNEKDQVQVLNGSWQPISRDTLWATIEEDGESYTIEAEVDVNGDSIDVELVEDYLGNECDSGSWTTEGNTPPSAGGSTNTGSMNPVEPVSQSGGAGEVTPSESIPVQ